MRLTAKMAVATALVILILFLCFATIGFINYVQASTPPFLYDVNTIFNQIKAIIIFIFTGLILVAIAEVMSL